jgi:predicted CXXCH cytochrome family protein
LVFILIKLYRKYFLKIPVLILLLIFAPLLLPQQTEDQCINCHLELEDDAAIAFKTDIHFKKGISCAACHGGDSGSDDMEISMSEEKGFIGVPNRGIRINSCINCHSDKEKMNRYGSDLPTNQYDLMLLSVHSKKMIGDEGLIVDCITCHGIHNIAAVKSKLSKVYPTRIVDLCGSCHSNAEYMKQYNSALPVDQVVKYRTSTHGKLNAKGDPNAAECVSCHGNHEIRAVDDPKSLVYATNIPQVCSDCHSDEEKMSPYRIPTNQYELFEKSVHGIALLEKQDLNSPSCNDCHGNHGAVPPGVESISKVCGSCHALNAELFEQSPHQKPFDENDLAECESCHGNHDVFPPTDDMLGIHDESVCVNCHSDQIDDKGYFVAAQMKELIDSLKLERDLTKEILEEAKRKSMDVSDADFPLQDLRQILIQARTIVHGFSIEKYEELTNEGFEITSKAKADGLAAIDDYYFRRWGLGIATVIVTILVIGLYVKLRKLEKKK